MRLAPGDAMARLVATTTACSAPSTPPAASKRCSVSSQSTTTASSGCRSAASNRSRPRLQRERNLESELATLLVEHWDRDDWSRLWWVRASRAVGGDAVGQREEGLAALLADRYAQYRDRPFDRVLVLRIVDVTGWAAS